MNAEAYEEIAKHGGIPKPSKTKKTGGKQGEGFSRPNCSLKATKGLKKTINVIPLEVKVETFKLKGNLCFMGFCPVCGGQARVTLEDDFHHFVHKSKGGKDKPEMLWPCKRDCHTHMHDHPLDEKEMFKLIEESGVKVIWKVNNEKQI
jgi:5-methylcytosine-specific restriction endonuclease McrA